jgi:octaprenyl-diphosphate synthase
VINEIKASVEADFAKVNALILEQLHSDVEMVENVGQYIVDAGGKRLRPLLTLLAASAVGDVTDKHITFAAIIEFIHTATLLHDDVVDQADLRRQQAAARTIWGNEASVLTGDYLLSMAFHQLTTLGNLELLKLMSDTTTMMARGELLQLTRSFNSANEQEYLEIITNKTACLFAAATQMGGTLAGLPFNQTKALYDYGMQIGLAFQIVDDVLDYSDSNRTGKPVGTDLQERKITLPLSHLLDKASPRDHQRIKQILTATTITMDDVVHVIRLMERYQSLHYALESGRQFVAQAQRNLQSLPNNRIRHTLEQIADFIVQRDL